VGGGRPAALLPQERADERACRRCRYWIQLRAARAARAARVRVMQHQQRPAEVAQGSSSEGGGDRNGGNSDQPLTPGGGGSRNFGGDTSRWRNAVEGLTGVWHRVTAAKEVSWSWLEHRE
jgi:hypothetical protein